MTNPEIPNPDELGRIMADVARCNTQVTSALEQSTTYATKILVDREILDDVAKLTGASPDQFRKMLNEADEEQVMLVQCLMRHAVMHVVLAIGDKATTLIEEQRRSYDAGTSETEGT